MKYRSPRLSLSFALAAAALVWAGSPALAARTAASHARYHMPSHGGPTPAEAIKRLLEGNRRYVASQIHHEDGLVQRRQVLAGGQHPFAIVLGCADSRVPPELVFDQGLGDLFVIRVAGNIPSDHVLGSIEYAVEHLGSSLIVVLGHERCGAVEAAVMGEKGHGRIGTLVSAIKPAVVDAIRYRRPATPNAVVDVCVRSNVSHCVHDILAYSPVVKHFVKAGRVRVVGARYDLDSGEVEFIN